MTCYSWSCCYSQDLTGDELLAKGQRLHYNARYDSAVRMFEQALLLFKKEQDDRKVIETSLAIGESLSNLGKCDSAELITRGALISLVEKFGESDPITADAFYYLSRIKGGCAGEFEDALPLVRKSAEIRKELFGEESLEIAYNFTMLGYYHTYLGNYDTARNYLQKALTIRRENDAVDKVELSHTIYYFSRLNERTAELKIALKQALEALDLRQSLLVPDHPTVSNSLNDLGTIYRTMGNLDQALKFYLAALEIRKKTLGEDHVNVGASYYTIGNLYGNQFDYRRAIHYIAQGNSIIYNKFGEEAPVLHTYYAYLGRMYSYVGDIEFAKHFFSLAENLVEKHLRENHPYRAIVYNLLGEFYSDQDDIEKQVNYLKKAQEIYQLAYGKETVREAGALVELGQASYKMSDTAQARQYYDQALNILTKRIGRKNSNVAAVFRGMGDMARDIGDLEGALDCYFKSIEAISVDSVASELEVDINSLTHKHRALRSYQKMATTYSKLYDKSGNVEHLEKSLDRFKFAIKLIDHIFDSYELEVSKTQLESETRGIYEGAVATAFKLYEATSDPIYKFDAFQIVEESKSPILLSQVTDREARTFNGVPKELLDEERDIKIEISFYKEKLRDAKASNDAAIIESYQEKIFTLQSEFEDFKLKLQSEYKDYFDYKYARQVINVNGVRKYLAAETGVIEYFQSKSAIYSFVITSEDFEMMRHEVPEDFNQWVDNYLRSLTDGNLIVEEARKADSLYISSAYNLFNLLVGPCIKKFSEPVTQLVVIPDGTLSNLNFSTLLSKQPDSENFRYNELAYLLVDFSVSYAFSSTLNFRSIKKNSNFSFAGFAPSYMQEKYASVDSFSHPLAYELVRSGTLPLPGAIAEVSTISSFLGGQSWLNEEASESNFKNSSGEYSVLHLAMHSLLNSDEPEYSELLFNNENDSLNDGYLTIDEIYNLDLNADMIVLSACSSGRGKVQVGEGPISFTRAFSYAGCPSVVMSMWKIPDAATTDIMVYFYSHLKSGDTKDVALKKAQLQYLGETDNPLYQHPFFWGSLVAMGNTEPIGSGMNRKVLALVISAIVLIGFFRIRKRIHANFR